MHYAVVRRRAVTVLHHNVVPCNKTEKKTIQCNTKIYNEVTCHTGDSGKSDDSGDSGYSGESGDSRG